MKRFTKICLIVCSVMLVIGVVMCAVGMSLGFGFRQFRVLAKEGAFYIGPDSPWFGISWFHDEWDDAWDDAMEDLEDDWGDLEDEWDQAGKEISAEVSGELEDLGDDLSDGLEDLEDIGSMGKRETLEAAAADWTKKEESWDTALVQNLDLEFYFGTLKIEPSETDQIEMSVNYRSIWKTYNRAIKWKIDGDTLKIRDSVDKKILRLFTHGAADAELIIRIPKDHAFDKLKMDIGAAKVSIGTLLYATDLDLCIGAGELKTAGNESIILKAGKLNLELGAGAVELAGIEADKLNVDGGTGSMKLREVAVGKADIDCGVGNVFMELKGNQEDYDYDVDCGIGQVVLGSDSYNGLGSSKKINNGAGRKIDIDCGLGRVEVTFNGKSMEG